MKRLPVELGPITADNVEQLRRINEASFPIHYNPAFYQEILKDSPNLFAYYQGQIVGAVCCTCSGPQLYIRTLAVLAAYRGRGIGSQLMEAILQQCNVDEIALHVQISNHDAMDFYIQKFGFVKGELVENYYRRIDPPHCYRLYKKLERNRVSE